MIKQPKVWCCDFCLKTEHEVRTLLAGPNNVAICNECVASAAASLINSDLPVMTRQEKDELADKSPKV